MQYLMQAAAFLLLHPTGAFWKSYRVAKVPKEFVRSGSQHQNDTDEHYL